MRSVFDNDLVCEPKLKLSTENVYCIANKKTTIIISNSEVEPTFGYELMSLKSPLRSAVSVTRASFL